MRRQHLFLIIPVLAVIAALVLFLQRDDTGGAPPSTPASASGSGLPTGSGANVPPSTSMNPTPSGTNAPADPNSTPGSATQRAPSGEGARPVERR
jgi:hypothetical protein